MPNIGHVPSSLPPIHQWSPAASPLFQAVFLGLSYIAPAFLWAFTALIKTLFVIVLLPGRSSKFPALASKVPSRPSHPLLPPGWFSACRPGTKMVVCLTPPRHLLLRSPFQCPKERAGPFSICSVSGKHVKPPASFLINNVFFRPNSFF